MRRLYIGSSSMFMLIAFFVFAAYGEQEPQTLRAMGNNVNIRARPSLRAEVIGQLENDEEVSVRHIGEEWTEITPPFRIDVWVHADFIRDGVVNSEKVNVRAGPGINFSIVGRLVNGDKVVARGQSGEWMNIEPPGESSLWVASEFLGPVIVPEPEPVVEKPVKVEEPVKPVEEPVVLPDTAVEDDAPSVVREVREPDPVPPRPVKPAPAPKPKDIRPPADLDLVPTQEQGVHKTYKGILRPAAYLINRPSPFRIVSHDEYGRSETLCYVKGNRTQLRALMGRKMTIVGHEYWIQGHRYPVLVPERIIVEY